MATDPDALVQARERVEALRAGFEEGKDGPVRLVQPHISWVLLTGAMAYKLKKADALAVPRLDDARFAASLLLQGVAPEP